MSQKRRQTLPALIVGPVAELILRVVGVLKGITAAPARLLAALTPRGRHSRPSRSSAGSAPTKSPRSLRKPKVDAARKPRPALFSRPKADRPTKRTSRPGTGRAGNARPGRSQRSGHVVYTAAKMGRILLVTVAVFNVLPLLTIHGSPALAGAIGYGGHLGNASSPSCSSPGSTTVASDADTFIEQSVPNANHGSDLTMLVASTTNQRKSLVHFPLPNIPANCALTEARLRLHQLQGGTVTLNVDRAASAWSESTTWNTRPASAGTASTVATSDGWVSWRVTSLVRDMYSNTNHGFVIDQPDTIETATQHFETRETGFDPELTLTWDDASGTSLSSTVTSSVPDGNSIIVSFGTQGLASGAVSATDTQGNTYSVDANAANWLGGRSVILSAHDVKGLSAGDTITVTHPSATARGMSVNHFSGLASTNTKDASSGAIGSNSSPTSGSATTSQPDELILGSFVISGDAVFSTGSGYTATPPLAASTRGSVHTQYRIVSSTGTYSATGSLNKDAMWAATMATYKMDIDPPVVSVTAPTANQKLNDATPTIAGTSSSNRSDSETVDVRIHSGTTTAGALVQSTTATRAANGSWTVDAASLTDGTYTVEASQDDGAANTGTSAPVTFSIDTTADAPTFAAPSSPSSDVSPEWTFSGEQNSTFECKLEKEGVVVSPLASCFSPAQFDLVDGDGTYTFFVRQIDESGNNSPFAWSDYELDTGTPNAPQITAPASAGNETDIALTFETEPGASAECKIEKGAQVIQDFASCSSPEIYSLVDGDGTYTFTVRQTDGAGNQSPSASQEYELDTVVPGTTIDSGPSGATSNANPTFDFSSDEPGASFECDFDGAGFTPCNSPQSYASLGDGDHTFRVRALDNAGNVDATPGERLFTVDTGAPSVTIDAAPSDPGNDATPTWDFSSELGATFECELTLGGMTVSEFGPCDAGTATYDLTNEADGTYTFTVRVEDAAGNTSTSFDTYALDTEKPESSSSSVALTRDTAITVPYSSSDVGSQVDEVELWVRAPGEVDFVLVDTDSSPDSASFDYTATQGDGWYRFYTRALDTAGNREDAPADADSITVVDTEAPDVTIDSAPPNATATSPFGFTFSSSDPTATFECSLTGDGSDDWAPCGAPASYPDDGDGTYTFKVRAIDPAGNMSTPDTHSFYMDATPPDVPAVGGPASPGNDASPEWNFAGEANATFECRVEKDGVEVSALQSCTSPNEYNLTDGDGTYTFFVRQRDEAGNVSSFAWTDYELDTNAPSAAQINGPSGPGNNTDVALTFSSGANTTAECKLEKDGQVIDDWTTCNSPNPYTLSDGDGTYTFSVRLTDPAGNESPVVSETYELDTVVPDTQIDSGPSGLINNANPSWGFSSAENGVSFECEMDGAGFDPCGSPKDYTSVSDGDHTFRVRAFDDAGNVDQSPAEATISVDTQAPGLTIDSAPADPGNDRQPRWDFSGESGAQLECELTFGGQTLSAFAPCNSGSVSYDLSNGEADGTYTFNVRATDAAGNSSTASDTYVLDTGDPDSVAWSTALTSDSNIAVTYTHADGLTQVVEVELWAKGPSDADFVLVDTDTSPDSASFAYVADQGDGIYEFYTRSIDEVGNREASPASADSSTELDTEGPEVTIDGSPSNPTDTSPFDFAFSSSDPSVTFECSLTTDGSDAYAPCGTPASFLDAGDATYTFKVRATDSLGNMGVPATVTFDYAAPIDPPTTDPPTTDPPTTDPPTTDPPTTEPPTTEPPTTEPPPPPPPPTTDAPTRQPTVAPTLDPEPPTIDEDPRIETGGEVAPEPKKPEPKETKEPRDEPAPERSEEPAPPPPADTDNGDPDLTTLATETVQAFGFPLLLALFVAAYLLVQYWLDRKDPKLAMAPVHAKHDLARFV